MSSLMSKIFRSSIFSSISFAILGILLIFKAEITVVSISYVIGGLLVAIGMLAILRNQKDNDQKNELDIVYGIVSIVLGIVVISNSKAIASIIPFAVGLIILVNSAFKIQYSIELKKSDNKIWKSTLIASLIEFLCGILLIFNPFKSAVFVTKAIGIIILIYSILDLISTISIQRTIKKVQNAIEEKVLEAKVIEEKEDKNE